jgi:malonyl-CoA/methylmalonyl-CoA synthetase
MDATMHSRHGSGPRAEVNSTPAGAIADLGYLHLGWANGGEDLVVWQAAVAHHGPASVRQLHRRVLVQQRLYLRLDGLPPNIAGAAVPHLRQGQAQLHHLLLLPDPCLCLPLARIFSHGTPLVAALAPTTMMFSNGAQPSKLYQPSLMPQHPAHISMSNLYSQFEERFPDDRSAIFIDADLRETYSYEALGHITARYANLLVQLGVRKGDRVAVQVEKSPQAIFLYLACLRAGAIFLPMNTAYQTGEVDYIVGDAEPKVLICTPEREADLADVATRHGIARLKTMDQAHGGSFVLGTIDRSEEFATVAVDEADDVAAILYTSGTTGRPKGAMLTHRNLASNTRALHEVWKFRPGDVLLHALPIFHAHGLFVATNTQLWNGGPMLFLNTFDADRVIDLLPQVTVFMGVPTYYVRLLASSRIDRHACRNMRLFVSGSAPLLEETFHDFQQRTGFTVVERYGMTETVMNTSNPIGNEKAGSVGPPLPGVEARVCDESGNVLPKGEVGTIEVRGPNVLKGYWRNEEKTRSEFRPDGFFVTGDMGRIDEDGYVWIMGRARDLVISGGFNVYPKEVELAIDMIDGVEESAIIGLPHPDFGEGVTAIVVRKTGGPDVTEQQIIDRLKCELANYKVPKRVIFVDALPRNTMGKVQKNQLRDELADTYRQFPSP